MADVLQSARNVQHGTMLQPKDEESGIERARDSESGSDTAAAEKLYSLEAVHALEDELAANDVGEENSPIEEVRAAVPNTDDPDMPCSTFRAWFLGVLFVLLGSGVNIFFSLRYPRYRAIRCVYRGILDLTVMQRADYIPGCTIGQLSVRLLPRQNAPHWSSQSRPEL